MFTRSPLRRWSRPSRSVGVLVSVVALACSAFVGLQITQASAATACTKGKAITDTLYNNTYPERSRCSLVEDAPIVTGRIFTPTLSQIGTFPSNRTLWFACQENWSGLAPGTLDYNDEQRSSTWWVYTNILKPTEVQTDPDEDDMGKTWDKAKGWGFVSAVYFSDYQDGNKAIPNIAFCKGADSNGVSAGGRADATPAAATPAATTRSTSTSSSGRDAGAYNPDAPMRNDGVDPKCTTKNESVTDDAGAKWTKHYCDNWMDAPVYGLNTDVQVGVMHAGTNWYACQKVGNANPQTSNRDGTKNNNNRWLWTLGDDPASGKTAQFNETKGWGYVPATYISQGGSNEDIPGVPVCE